MKRRRGLWTVLFILYAVGIFVVSSLPLGEGVPFVSLPYGDKLLHTLEYAIFFLLTWKALPNRQRRLAALILTAIYGGSDELHQFFVASRTASLLDWLADLTGGGIAALLTSMFSHLPLFARSKLRILTLHHHDEEG
jgi:hypothetical protein